jgi:hypothetical protein
MPTPRDILAANRRDALGLVETSGVGRTRLILENAERELVQRLALVRGGTGTFTYEQMRSALFQIRLVLLELNNGIAQTVVDGALQAAEAAAAGTVDYLGRMDVAFRGMGTQPLALNEASMFEQARVGARSSVLRRLASSGEGSPGAPAAEHVAKQGILDRYGMNVIGEFEGILQRGLLTRKPWDAIKGDLIGSSQFLQAKPAFWAERIVRTELMGAYNRGSWEANRDADDQLGDMCKIVSATFDDRTGSDSFAVHGQIRRPDEAFESWFGLYQHPPNRPNDREIVVPHRVSWPLPPYLKQRADGEIAARWKKEKRKGPVPPRPNMTTIPLELFGNVPPPKVKETEARAPRERVPSEDDGGGGDE